MDLKKMKTKGKKLPGEDRQAKFEWGYDTKEKDKIKNL